MYYYTITQVSVMKTVLKIAFLLLSSLVLIPAASAARQGETTLRGTIIDESGVPAGFATAFLSLADGAVVCGVATRIFDTGSVFLSAAAGVLWGYFESGLDVLSDTVPEMIVSVAVLTPAVAFGLIPRAPARRGAREVRRNGEQGGAGGPTEKKLIDLSRGLRAVSKELYSISDELTAPSADDVRAVCDEAFEEVCAGCGLSGACRGAERTDADRVKEEIAGQLLHGGRASASAVSRAMAKRCYNIDRIIDG